ncbi:hypothetical protein P5V15_002283 [Pogonomyrmex californicus]
MGSSNSTYTKESQTEPGILHNLKCPFCNQNTCCIEMNHFHNTGGIKCNLCTGSIYITISSLTTPMEVYLKCEELVSMRYIINNH